MLTNCSERRCATCRFWNRQGPQIANAIRDPRAPSDEGTCEAHTPVLVLVAAGSEGTATARWPVPLFPRTHETRGCGEWEPAQGGGGGDDGERVVAFPFDRAASRVAAA